MTEKYGVELDPEKVKVGEALDVKARPAPCPKCGSTEVDIRSNVPVCPNCGTEPFEAR